MLNKVSKIFAEHDPLNQTFEGDPNQKGYQIQDFLITDLNSRNILHRAALQQNPKIIQEILAAYASIDSRNLSIYVNVQDKFGITAVQMCCFADYNQRAQCLTLFSEYADFNLRNPRTLWSTAHWVAFYGDVASLALLFDKEVVFFTPDYQGLYPLDLAGLNEKDKCASKIVESLVNLLVEYEDTKVNQKRRSQLFDRYFIEYDRYLVNPLLKISLFYWSCYFKFSLNEFTKLTRMYYFGPYLSSTPFHISTKRKNIEAFRFMLQQRNSIRPYHGLLLSNDATPFNNRIFIFSKEEQQIYKSDYMAKVVEMDAWEHAFLSSSLDLLDQVDKFGNTPLHYASLVNDLEMVSNLISEGCSITIENKEFWRAEDFTTDRQIHDTIIENETFKRKLVKSIYRFLLSSAIPTKLDPPTKKYLKLSTLILNYNQNDLQESLIQLYQQGEELINPDYVLKCSNSPGSLRKLNFQIQLLLKAKFQVYLSQSKIDDSYYLMLQLPLNELQFQAMIQKLEVKLIHSYDYEPFDFILKEQYEPFRSLQRQQVIEDYLNKIINLMDLKEQKLVVDSYRMHRYGGTQKIKLQWLQQEYWYLPQPLNQWKDYFLRGDKSDFHSSTILRLYFGEKIAFFFAWKGYLTCFMVFVAIPGLALQIYLLATSDFNSLWVPIWVIYQSLWSTICVEFWKRKSCEINARWGMLDLMNSDELKIRSEFSGDEEMNLMTHEVSKFEKKVYTVIIYAISFPLIVAFSSIIIGVFIGISTYQRENQLYDIPSKLMLGTAQGICISVLNLIYSMIVNIFVEMENHKYEQHYETSMISKNVLFKLINSYIAVFYTAYFKSDFTYEELFYLLLPVLVIKQISYFVVALIFPQVVYKYNEDKYFMKVKKRANLKQIYHDGIENLWSKVVGEQLRSSARCVLNLNTGQPNPNFDMDSVELNGVKYQTNKQMITNYFMETMSDFGYITLFSAAFPVGPFIFILMSIIEIRMKLYSFLYVYRKPVAERTAGIGQWLSIWEMMSFLGVFTNYSLLFLKQSQQVNDVLFDGQYSQTTMLWIFIIFVIVNVVIKYVMQLVIPDKPEWVVKWEEEITARKKNHSQLVLKEQECQQLHLKVAKLEKLNQKLTLKLEHLEQQEGQVVTQLQSPEKQTLDYSSKEVSDQIARAYYKTERDILLEKLEVILQLCSKQKVNLLVCGECQSENMDLYCSKCQIQQCQRCNKKMHLEAKQDHTIYFVSLPVKDLMWRKMQYFAFPTNVQSHYFTQLKAAYDILSIFYEDKPNSVLFLGLEDFNAEEKWYLNKIAYYLYRKQKATWLEFLRVVKIFQQGLLEQKMVIFIELLDEDDDQMISKHEFQQFVIGSLIQNVSTKLHNVKLFETETFEKKDLTLHAITQLQRQNHTKVFFQELLQQF